MKTDSIKKIQFGNITIGGPRTIVVAEIAVSHNGDMDTAKKLIDEAKVAGADIAKFQLHLADTEMIPNSIMMWGGPLYDILLETHFTPEQHKEVMEYCEKVDIEYLCTPFCTEAVDVLHGIGVKAFKTGSGELDNLPQHRRLAEISAKTGKPVIVSTGMSKWEEIADTVKVYEEEGTKDNLVLMNCTSEYPPSDYSHANLGLVPRLRDEFAVWSGQSDHTLDNYTAYASVALGAKIIEKHFTLDRKQRGPDHSISLEPHMLRDLVDGIRKIEVALGDEKIISKEEQVVRDWAFHSITTVAPLKKGEELTKEIFEKKLLERRPRIMEVNGKKVTGIPSKYLDSMYQDKLLGKKVKWDLPKDVLITWDDVE